MDVCAHEARLYTSSLACVCVYDVCMYACVHACMQVVHACNAFLSVFVFDVMHARAYVHAYVDVMRLMCVRSSACSKCMHACVHVRFVACMFVFM